MTEHFGFDDVVALVAPPRSSVRDDFLGRVLSWRRDRSAYGVMSFDNADVRVIPADQLRLILRRSTLHALLDQADV